MLPADNASPEEQTAVQEAARHARTSAVEILKRWGDLSTSERRQVIIAFRSAIIPRKRAGRKQSEALTAAFEAWKGGMRGLVLFQTNIQNWDRLSRWRRKAEQRSLMDAIYSRNRRERAKQRGSSVGEDLITQPLE
jgi:hypothetical protein